MDDATSLPCAILHVCATGCCFTPTALLPAPSLLFIMTINSRFHFARAFFILVPGSVVVMSLVQANPDECDGTFEMVQYAVLVGYAIFGIYWAKKAWKMPRDGFGIKQEFAVCM